MAAQEPPEESTPRGGGLAERRHRPLSAFICYARETDTESREKIGDALRSRGVELRGDWQLTPGPSYKDQIAALIRESDVFVAIISRLSVASQECRDEISQANLQKKKLLPVQIQDGFDRANLHEALRLPQWTLLRPIDDFQNGIVSLERAINTDFDLLVVHTWLTQRADDWEVKGRPGSGLLSGRDLKEAEIWLPRASANQLELPNVTPLQADFVLASQRARTRRAQWVAGITAVIVVVLSMLTLIAYNKAVEATEKAQIAESRRLAAESFAALTEYPQRSLLLAVEAVKMAQPLHGVRVATAEQSLRDALAFVGGQPLVRSQSQTSVVGMSPDNHWLVTGSSDGTARLWDLTAKNPAASLVVLGGHKRAVVTVGISNRWLVTGSEDNTACLWDLTAEDPAASRVVLHGHEGAVNALWISSDNHRLVTGSDDKTARLWDLTAKDPAASPVVLRGHGGAVNAVGISQDSRWLVTGSYDNTVRLWLLQVSDLVDLARTTVGRNFFADEWQLYFSGEKYRKTFDELPGPEESVTQKNN